MPFCECLLERREKRDRDLTVAFSVFRFVVMLLDYSYSNYFRMNVTLIELNVIDLDLAVVFL